MDEDQSSQGLLVFLSIGTLIVFYLIVAAMHDIAHGEPDVTLEYHALTISGVAFALLYRAALTTLSRKCRVAWLGGAGVLLFIFDLAACNARIHPKYPADPMLGSLFLTVGVPALGMIVYDLLREHRRVHELRY